MNQPLWQLKKEMCDVGHRIWLRGYCGGNEGNHSVRIGEDRVLCTPTGISKGFMTPDDLCVVDMEGNQVEANAKGRRRSSEILMHLAIYKARADVKSVVHSHPPHATAFALANMPLPEGIHPEAEVFLGVVPMAEYATPSKPVLGQSIIDVMTPDTNSVLMGNHGVVCFEKTLIDAYYRLEILDQYSRLLLLTRQLGAAPNVLNPSQMTELLEVKQKFGLNDPRLACAPEGCASQPEQPFFAPFDVRPSSAACECHCDGSTDSASNDGAFEQMVQAITDQIMAGV